MPIENSSLNFSKAESAANTMTRETKEVPMSEGARRVFIEDIMLDATEPSVVASTKTMVEVMLSRAKLDADPGGIDLSEDGVVHKIESITWSDATPLPILMKQPGPKDREGPFEVYRHRDGKFYVTLCVKGTNLTAAATAYAHIEFSIERD